MSKSAPFSFRGSSGAAATRKRKKKKVTVFKDYRLGDRVVVANKYHWLNGESGTVIKVLEIGVVLKMDTDHEMFMGFGGIRSNNETKA